MRRTGKLAQRGAGDGVPHSAWHVVRQVPGRVKPALRADGETAVDDDAALEAEADRMGAAALRAAQRSGA